MKIETEKDKRIELTQSYLSGHDRFTPEEKEAIRKEIEHEQRRLAKARKLKVKEDD